MGACGTCRQNLIPTAAPALLFQIRRGYRAEWNGLAFSIEQDSTDWMVRVQDFSRRETIYTARRSQASAAQLIAAEFGVFRMLGPDSRITAAQLAGELKWQEYW